MPHEEGFHRLLGDLSRETPPELPVEELIARAAAWRARRLGVAGAFTATALIVVILAFRREPEPPVHLQLKVLQVPAPLVRAEPESAPAELSLP